MLKGSYRASFAPDVPKVREYKTVDLDELARLDDVTEMVENSEKLMKSTEVKHRTMAEIVEQINATAFDEEDDAALFFSDSSEEELEKKFVIEPFIFESLGSLPNVSDISDESLAHPLLVKEMLSEATLSIKADMGMFVDPLTGDIIRTEEEETEEEEEYVEEEEHVTSVLEMPASSAEDEELLALLGEQEKQIEEEPEETAIEEEVLDVFETFLELDMRKVSMEKEDEEDTLSRRDSVVRGIFMATREFVEEIIDCVVERSEYVPPRVILRKSLDKKKLMSELHKLLELLYAKNYARSFLNRKTVEYFRRKGMFRAILDDHPDTATTEMQKFKMTVRRLDCLLSQQNDVIKCTQNKIADLTMSCAKIEATVSAFMAEFEDMVRELFYRENHVKFNEYIDELLSRIHDLREDISSVRLALIQRQHTYARLKQKLDDLENIGDGLTMKDFEHLLTETQAISKKIEERNTELAKARIRFNCDLHIMAHMREKCHLIRDGVMKQYEIFNELNEERKVLRRQTNAHKVERLNLYKEIRRLRIQGGLLDNPVLMLDYDETVNRLLTKRGAVNKLKTKQADIQSKIAVLEKTKKKRIKQDITTQSLFDESVLYTNDIYASIRIYDPL